MNDEEKREQQDKSKRDEANQVNKSDTTNDGSLLDMEDLLARMDRASALLGLPEPSDPKSRFSDDLMGITFFAAGDRQQEYEEHPLTEYLDFTFSSFGSPLVDQKNARIILPVREFKVYSGFPGYDEDVIVLEGNIIFEQVINSVRSIREINDEATSNHGRTQYKDLYRLDDGPFPKVSGNPFSFYIGGPTYDPPGWVEWDIDTVEIKIEAQKHKRS